MSDVIDTLAGIAPGSPLDAVRAQRPQARLHAQASYDSLFTPLSDADASKLERCAIACFVAGLHGRPETEAFYGSALAAAGASTALQARDRRGRGGGPGRRSLRLIIPKGRSVPRTRPVPSIASPRPTRDALGARLAAAFEHTHMLVFHPRDSAPPYLQALLDAGWSTTGIVVISQLVAFLSYQIRVVAGLRVLNARPA